MQVAVAQTGIGGTQQHLVCLRLRDLESLDGQRLLGLVHDGGAHRLPPQRLCGSDAIHGCQSGPGP